MKYHAFGVPISPAERAVLELLAEGKSNKQIARDLNVTPATIYTHLFAMYRKTNTHRAIQLLLATGVLVRKEPEK